MFFKNARIYCSDFHFHIGAFEVKDGVFGEILPQAILMYNSKLPAFSTIVGMLTGLFIIFA